MSSCFIHFSEHIIREKVIYLIMLEDIPFASKANTALKNKALNTLPRNQSFSGYYLPD
jgi:hypothetical protein